MNLLLFDPDELPSEGRRSVEVTGRRAEHLLEVLRVAPGRKLRCGVLGGPLGSATVTSTGRRAVHLELTLDGAAPGPLLDIELVVALPRPPMLRRILQSAATFSVRALSLVGAHRVQKSYFQTPRLRPEAIREDLTLGCEQGGSSWLPEVRSYGRLDRYLDRLRADDATADAPRPRGVADPRGERSIAALCAADELPAGVLAIGPEGGWIDPELDRFAQHGFSEVALGRPILRSDVAVAVALGQLELLARRAV